jgi:hypothetical protein
MDKELQVNPMIEREKAIKASIRSSHGELSHVFVSLFKRTVRHIG